MNNSFIQSSLFQNSSTTFPKDGFCNNDKVNDTSPTSDDDYIFDDIDGKKVEDINGEDNNLDKKNKSIRKNKNKKRKTQNTKDQNEEINNKTKHIDNKNIVNNNIHRNSTASLPKSKETIFIVGDSMVKKNNGFLPNKRY